MTISSRADRRYDFRISRPARAPTSLRRPRSQARSEVQLHGPICDGIEEGLELLSEQAGGGTPVRKHSFYRIKLRMWLHRREPVRWNDPWECSIKALTLRTTTLFSSPTCASTAYF